MNGVIGRQFGVLVCCFMAISFGLGAFFGPKFGLEVSMIEWCKMVSWGFGSAGLAVMRPPAPTETKSGNGTSAKN